jgi:hypothetical protein
MRVPRGIAGLLILTMMKWAAALAIVLLAADLGISARRVSS